MELKHNKTQDRWSLVFTFHNTRWYSLPYTVFYIIHIGTFFSLYHVVFIIAGRNVAPLINGVQISHMNRNKIIIWCNYDIILVLLMTLLLYECSIHVNNHERRQLPDVCCLYTGMSQGFAISPCMCRDVSRERAQGS